ncbi:MAG TPA: outer membrane beta-barrel protein [Candidatus Kryptonia bacterium]|nr:outer membrane beta-barrel protein [Candidatus Kryptonia bacterium]
MRTGIRNIMVGVSTAGLLLAGRTPSTAQTLQQRVEDLEKKVDTQQKSIADSLGIKFHGVVAIDYQYDINAPDGSGATNASFGPVALRAFENEKNSVMANLANLHVERQPDSGLGFVFDFDFGKTADVVNNSTYFGRHNGNDPIPGNGTDFFDARQFYLTYTVPVGSGIKLKAGRFVTLAGEEVIKAYNNINYNVSNSILFGFAIPFTHTGLMASYSVMDQLSFDLGLVNGWDAVSDNNDGKSFHGGVTIAPDPKFSTYTSLTYGPEQNLNGQSKRFLATTVFTVKPIDQLTLLFEYDYGNESNVSLTSPVGPDATSTTMLYRAAGNKDWQGAAAYAVVAPTDDWQIALRGEVFDDPDGVRTLFQQGVTTNDPHVRGPGADFWEFTPTLSYKLADGLWWRNEYRHDESDKKFFPQGDHFAKGQDTVTTELIYTF